MRSKTWLRRLARTRRPGAGQVAWIAVPVTIVIAQRLAIALLDRGGFQADLRRALFFLTTAVLMLLALHFRRFVGAWLVAAGIALNFAPMAAHGGLMPVSIETVQASGAFPEVTEADIGHQIANSKDIILRRADIRLYPLSDRFYIEAPLYGGNIYSAGDFVIGAGVVLAAAQAVATLFRAGGQTRREEALTG